MPENSPIVPPGLCRHSPKFRAILAQAVLENRPELIPSGREIEMWIYYSILDYLPSSVRQTNRPTMIEKAIVDGDFDNLEYLVEFISTGPIDDEFTDPVRYEMLNKSIQNMSRLGVVTAVKLVIEGRNH